MIECNPSPVVVGSELISGGECPRPYECTVARALLCVREPDLAKHLDEYPCGKQAEILYINGERALVDTSEPDTSRLDAVQGSSEARTELHQEVLLGSTGADDAVMRQESWQAAELGSEAGQDGGGVW